MATFTARFKRQIRDATETFLRFILLLVFAIILTFIHDWMQYTKRPEWLCIGTEGLSIFAFITDAIVLIGVFIRVIVNAVWERK